jgi:predicted acylesterase/phospholipase RssA
MKKEPKKECDLVMKGGITSGVIYPRLIARLSEVYNLRNIGGTSAGAIAAAAAAAAQLGVHARTNSRAFEQIDALPDVLSGPAKGREGSVLLNLFQPQSPTRRHFAFLVSMLNAPSNWRIVWRACKGLVRYFPVGSLIGILPGIILLGQATGIATVISLCIFLIGLIGGAAAAAFFSLGRTLPSNYFGLCNGMSLDNTALTPWLNHYLNGLAGKSSNEPLTFGELWAGRLRNPDDKEAFESNADDPIVRLAMMTTALNLGRPYRLPFEHGDVFFVEEELQQFFPKSVNDWLIAKARRSETAQQLTAATGRKFHALPVAADLPVIVAVRLSLSFPILLSAIPLYAVDRTLKANREKAARATRIYFSDGGICSNFPVHFFDAPLPLRPTFGVNLREFHPEHPDERVFLPEPLRNNQGLKNHYPALPDRPGIGSVVKFLASIVTTMQDWRDQLQLAMPGFRDRIVHVSHTKHEGGLNLNMDPDVIRVLGDSGAEAATALINAFAGSRGEAHDNAWNNHQRVRVRIALAVLQKQLDAIARSLDGQVNPTYEEIVLNPDPPSYEFARREDASRAAELFHRLKNLGLELRGVNVDLSKNAPRPTPELRIVPRI